MSRSKILIDYYKAAAIINSAENHLHLPTCENTIEAFKQLYLRPELDLPLTVQKQNAQAELLIDDLEHLYQIQRETHYITTTTTAYEEVSSIVS